MAAPAPHALADSLGRMARGDTTLWDSAPVGGKHTRPFQTVYDDEDPAHEVYLLLEGTIALRSPQPDPVLLFLLHGPGLFGDLEILGGAESRTGSAISVGRAKLLCFSAQDLLHLRQTSWRDWLERDLAQRSLAQAQGVMVRQGNLEERLRILAQAMNEEPISLEDASKLLEASIKSTQRAARALMGKGLVDLGESGLVNRHPSAHGAEGMIHRSALRPN